jgi:hypothetical protein
VGNCTDHPGRMARAYEVDFGTPWACSGQAVVPEGAAVLEFSHGDHSIDGSVRGEARGDDRPQVCGAGLRRWAPTHPYLSRLGVATILLAIVLYAGSLCALVGPTTTSRQSAGRGVSLDGLTLRQEEEGQMRCYLHVTGSSFGRDAGPIGRPRDEGDRVQAAPVDEAIGRSRRSVGSPT